jgi:hypothetical protein
MSIFTETAIINTRTHRGIRLLRFSRITFERVKIFDALSQVPRANYFTYFGGKALNLVTGVTENAFYKKAPVLKLAEIAIREEERHSSAEFPAFSWLMRTQLYCGGFRASLSQIR